MVESCDKRGPAGDWGLTTLKLLSQKKSTTIAQDETERLDNSPAAIIAD